MSSAVLPPWEYYLDAVPAEGLSGRVNDHLKGMQAFLGAIPEDTAGFAYAPDKWTVRQVVGHVLVSHRVFLSRAVFIARGESQPLPGYDENLYAAHWPESSVTLGDLAQAYRAEATATRAWLGLLRSEERAREGIANGTRVTPDQLLRALVGHESHHVAVLRERYGLELTP